MLLRMIADMADHNLLGLQPLAMALQFQEIYQICKTGQNYGKPVKYESLLTRIWGCTYAKQYANMLSFRCSMYKVD